jgi:hypothetical protein
MELLEHPAHGVEERRVVGGIGKIGRIVGDHRVVGPSVGKRLGERSARHRHRQLDVVRRVGRHEVDAPIGDVA